MKEEHNLLYNRDKSR